MLLEKFGEFTDNPKNIEFIFRIDNDDMESQEFFNVSPNNERYKAKYREFDLKIIVGDRLEGFKDIHIFHNEMYRMSEGKWIWFFNDDAYVITKSWDSILANVEYNQILFGKIFGLPLWAQYDDGWPKYIKHDKLWCDFPIIPKSFFDCLGYAAPGSADRYWIEIGYKLNIIKKVNIEFYHKERTKNKPEGETRRDKLNLFRTCDAAEWKKEERYYDEKKMIEVANKIKEFLKNKK
jgi:hypothetical protein